MRDVDRAVAKSKLDEFRNTNVPLIKERHDLKKPYEGIDPTLHPNPLPGAEIEKVIENRIKGLQEDR